MITKKSKNIIIIILITLIVLTSFKVTSQSQKVGDSNKEAIKIIEDSELITSQIEETIEIETIETVQPSEPPEELEEILEEPVEVKDQEETILVDIEEIDSATETASAPSEEQTIDLSLSNMGEVVLEVKDAPIGAEVNKEETINEKGNKEITISSNEHIETEIIAYTNIPEISKGQKNSVKIYWINKNQEISIKEFIDSDNNDLYDRISWIVPHLSEQIFEIIIDFETDDSSPIIEIITNNTPTGEVSNPIEFEFSIDYINLNDVECILMVDGTPIPESTNFNINNINFTWSHLPNGQHNWTLSCKDSTNDEKGFAEGYFTINENFSTSLSKEVYVLNGDGGLIGGAGELNITSAESSNVSIKIQRSSSLYYPKNATTPHTLILDTSIINQIGNYSIRTTFNNLAKPITKENNFSVAMMNISANKEEADTDEDISFYIKIESPINNIEWYTLNFDDGNIAPPKTFENDQSTIQDTIKHQYESSGNFVVTLTARIDGKTYSITKNGISIESSEDNKEPTVNLLNPSNNKEINKDRVVFEYKASDNIKIKNCTFELYNYSGNLGTLDYSKTHENLDNDEKVQISLEKFESVRYSWNVYCCDNSSNCNNDLEYYREFNVDLDPSSASSKNEDAFDHERKDEIDDLISKINSFIQKEASYSIEEKEILEELGISNELETDKKILTQINTFLGNDINFIEDETLKEKTKKEREDQIGEIKNRIPLDMKILESNEYVKNSITKNMEEIIGDYALAKNIKADKRTLESLSKLNYELQNYIIVSAKVRQIEITYVNNKKDLTLITKKIDIKNNTFNTLLEVIPKEIIDNASEATFLMENKIIKEDPIFEISVDNLNDEKIIYYIEGLVDLKTIQETDTLAFKEFAISNKITGFSILDFGGGYFFYYIIFIIFIILIAYLVFIYIRKRRIIKWKKEENVSKIFSYIKQANKSLEKKDVESAKENYHKIQELYPLIPEGCKKHLNKKIKKILTEIDKKEIFNLVKEYEQAKIEKRQEDAEILYKNIQSIYKRLPKKYREKVYEKISK